MVGHDERGINDRRVKQEHRGEDLDMNVVTSARASA
jgi:hypothetical protein